MALRPRLEELVRDVEERASNAALELDRLCESIDAVVELVDSENIAAIPVETFDDISVVNHTVELQQTVKRMRRETDEAPVPFVARDRRRRV